MPILFQSDVGRRGAGYDLICGDDRANGKLQTSAKNELLTLQTDVQPYLLVESEPFVHHYEGSPCGLGDKNTCEKPEMRYMLIGGKAKITAHCQAWDKASMCGSLQVGTTYHCWVDAADRDSSQALVCVGAGWLGIDRSEIR